MSILRFRISEATGKLTVNAGIDQTLNSGNSNGTLTATFTGGTGTLTEINWTQTSGDTVTINSATSLSTTLSGLEDGKSYTFNITIKDSNLTTSSDDVNITVEAASAVTPIIDSIVFPNGNCCDDNLPTSDRQITKEYDSSSIEQTDSYDIFTLLELTSSALISSGIQNLRLTSLVSKGELAIQGSGISSTPFNVAEASITNNHFEIWGKEVNGSGNSGSHKTNFSFIVVDNNGTDVELINVALSIRDLAKDNTFDGALEVNGCSDTNGQNTLVDITGKAEVGDLVRLQGTTTNFNGADKWYRLTFGGNNQFYDLYSTLGHSTYIVQIDNEGEIIASTDCS